MTEYLQPTERLLVRADRADRIRAADTLVFDIDGVLMDVTASFREVTRETVQYFLKKNFDLDSLQLLVAPEDIDTVKAAGRFNNDWDVTEALAAFYIHKIRSASVKGLLELKAIEPALDVFFGRVKEAGGGLDNVYALLTAAMPSTDVEPFKEAVKAEEVRQIFQEVYAGIDYCQTLYKRQPRFFRGSGKLENEKGLLNPETRGFGRFRAGIWTGRTRNEAELALSRLGLEEAIDPEAVVFDDGMRPGKPDPTGLAMIADYLESRNAIYAGDIVDDWQAVKNYPAGREDNMYFCMVKTGGSTEAMMAYYKEEGVDIIADTVNDLLDWLKI